MTEPEQSNRDKNQDNDKDGQQSSDYSRFNPMRPVHWYGKLQAIEKFNFWIFLFTGVLSAVGVFQVHAYIETERAFVVVEEVRLFAGEPTSDAGGLDMALFIKNVGKHLAIVTEFNVETHILIVDKVLFEHPRYMPGASSKLVVAPMVSQQKIMVPLRQANEAPPPIPQEDIVRGIKDGTIPLHVYGRLKYKLGYFMLKGVTGYCFTYVPVAKRRISQQTFNTCDNQNYIYAE